MSTKMNRDARLAKLAAKPTSSTVRPLGTPRSKKAAKAEPKAPEGTASENILDADEKTLDSSIAVVIPFTQTQQVIENVAPETEPISRRTTMTFNLKGFSRNGKTAFYTGAATVLRFALSAFPNKTAPQSFEVAEGTFAPPAQPKAKMTPEERKAARAAKPKPTLAERIARREAALAKDREKLAAMQTAGSEATL